MSQQPVEKQREQWIAETAAAIAAVYAASKADILSRVRLGHLYDALRQLWADRLAAVMAEHGKSVAYAVGQAAAEQYGDGSIDLGRMDQWLEDGAQARARGWQQGIEDRLRGARLSVADLEAEVNDLVAAALSRAQAEIEAEDLVSASANFGDLEAAKAAGKTTKTWHHVPGEKSSRVDHQEMDGETVGINERFSNRLRFPRSPGPPSEVANCRCYLTYGGGDESEHP